MLKSTFNFRVYLLPFLMVVFLTVSIMATIDQLIKLNIEYNLQKILTSAIFSFFLVFLILHEFRNKIINVIVSNEHIEKSTYLAPNKIYGFKEFDGFQTRVVKGKFENYEYLYLIKNNKKVITLSQTYHKNYHELKAIISNNSKNLGLSDYGLFDEIKEILTLN